MVYCIIDKKSLIRFKRDGEGKTSNALFCTRGQSATCSAKWMLYKFAGKGGEGVGREGGDAKVFPVLEF